jgi:DNA-binding XRE family transcriptional regulator
MAERSKKTTDAVDLMDRWYGGDPEWDQMVIEEEIKARVGQIVYHLRTEAGLSQTRLAEMTGVTQAMISKLENADYEGDYFGLLLRACFVLHKKLDVGGPGVPLPSGVECCAVVAP